MEFRKMLMITLYAEQKKRHRFIEQLLILKSPWVWNGLLQSIVSERADECILKSDLKVLSKYHSNFGKGEMTE